MYGQESVLKGSLTESPPHLAKGKKGVVRSEIANQLLKAHEKKRVSATIWRGSDFFGLGGTNSILDFFVFPKVLKGKKVKMFGNLDKKHSFIFLEDFGKGLVTLAENEKTFGEVWHLPHGETLTTGEFLQLISEVAEVDSNGKIGTNPKVLLSIGGLFVIIIKEMKEVIYQGEMDWVVNHDKFNQTFLNFEPTPNKDAIRKTLN